METGRARSLAVKMLRDAGIGSCVLEADLLLEWAAGFTRAFIHAHPEKRLSHKITARFFSAVQRRLKREPLQHITGEAPFFGLPFRVGPGCLVPRQETEVVVQTALGCFYEGVFVDWGTGSGCVAAAVLSSKPMARGIAVECSAQALSIAWRNFKNLGFLHRLSIWHCCNPWSVPLEPESVDMVVSNPPYIKESELPELMPEVRLFDPAAALCGGPDGLDAYRILLPWAGFVLKRGSFLVAEVGGNDQAERLKALEVQGLQFLRFVDDLSGIRRGIVWKKEPV